MAAARPASAMAAMLLSVAACTSATSSGARSGGGRLRRRHGRGHGRGHDGRRDRGHAGGQPAGGPVRCGERGLRLRGHLLHPAAAQVAYGVKPLLDRGIDGRGETVVLPELAESSPNPPLVTDMRQDMAAFDATFRLPAARMRVDSSLVRTRTPWLAFGEEVLDVEMVHALAPGATLVILLLPTDSLDNTANTVAAAVASLRRGSAEGDVLSISAAGQVGGEHCVSQRAGRQRERRAAGGREPPRDRGRRLG